MDELLEKSMEEFSAPRNPREILQRRSDEIPDEVSGGIPKKII